MAEHDHPLTPDAIRLIATIEEAGSFAAAARVLGKVPSALSYSVRQLETALDVLLFDRSSRTAVLTPAGRELLSEGRRLLLEMDAVASRVKRVASGWEGQLTLAANALMCPRTLLDLVAAFLDQRDDATPATDPPETASGSAVGHLGGAAVGDSGPGDRRRCRRQRGHRHPAAPARRTPFRVRGGAASSAAHGDGPLDSQALQTASCSRHRRQRHALSASSRNLLPGQDVLTVPTLDMKIDAHCAAWAAASCRSRACATLVADGRLVVRQHRRRTVRALFDRLAQRRQRGRALDWWLQQLDSPRTRQALLGGVHR
jgi:DNA-binding transcriptional LysR family regulator